MCLRDQCLEMLGRLYSDLAKDLGKEGGAWGPLTSSVTRARYLAVWWHLRERPPACTWQMRYACPADSHASTMSTWAHANFQLRLPELCCSSCPPVLPGGSVTSPASG